MDQGVASHIEKRAAIILAGLADDTRNLIRQQRLVGELYRDKFSGPAGIAPEADDALNVERENLKALQSSHSAMREVLEELRDLIVEHLPQLVKEHPVLRLPRPWHILIVDGDEWRKLIEAVGAAHDEARRILVRGNRDCSTHRRTNKPGRPQNPERDQRISEAVAAGHSLEEVGRRFEISKNAVGKALKRHAKRQNVGN